MMRFDLIAPNHYLDTETGVHVFTRDGQDPAEVVAEASAMPQPDVADYEYAIQGHVDRVAQVRGYRHGDALSSYATSTVPGWAAEAGAFIEWRDAVWTYAHVELARVLSGQRSQPSVEEFIAELPEIQWPT